MDIRNREELKNTAQTRLSGVTAATKIVAIYSVAVAALALLVSLGNMALDQAISQTGGLGNMGTRTFLATLQRVLPLVQSAVVMCLELGYVAAAMRMARGQYVSTRTLKLGFDRFWPLLRLTVLRGLLFVGLGVATVYIGSLIFALTPLSREAMAVLEPMVSSMDLTNPASLVLDDATYGLLMKAMIPCFILMAVLYAVLALPVWYRYRMAGYVLIDKPAYGALAALRESRMLLHRHRVELLRLDLSYWYYYLATVAISVLAYGDSLLPMMGISLPWSQTFAFYFFYVLSLALQVGLYLLLRNKVEMIYALAYDALRPKETPKNEVVLGNIFDMR